MPQTLQAATLRTQVASIIAGTGSTPAEAEQVAANLVLANLSGHDSHGVGMVPRYVDAVAEGGLKPNAAVKVNLDAGPMLALDGQRGYGQIVGVQAMELGIERAKQHGSCILSLANAHHLGRIGHFAEMATAQGPGLACTSSTCCRGRWSRPGAAATGASAPTRAASAFRWRAPSPSSSTSRPAAWRRARCASPTTRASACRPAT